MTVEEILNRASEFLLTVPLINERDEYEMHDMRWVLASPSFFVPLLKYVTNKDMHSQYTEEEKIQFYLANMFSKKNKDTTISNAREWLRRVLDGAKEGGPA